MRSIRVTLEFLNYVGHALILAILLSTVEDKHVYSIKFQPWSIQAKVTSRVVFLNSFRAIRLALLIKCVDEEAVKFL